MVADFLSHSLYFQQRASEPGDAARRDVSTAADAPCTQRDALNVHNFLTSFMRAASLPPTTTVSSLQSLCVSAQRELEVTQQLWDALCAHGEISPASQDYMRNTRRQITQWASDMQWVHAFDTAQISHDLIASLCKALEALSTSLQRARDAFMARTGSLKEWRAVADILWPDVDSLFIPARFFIASPDGDLSHPRWDQRDADLQRQLNMSMSDHDADH